MEGASAGEKTTLVTLGPLTNIALLLKAYPQVKEHIDRIVMMGGALTRGNLGVMSEFNVGVDPEAQRLSLHPAFMWLWLALRWATPLA